MKERLKSILKYTGVFFLGLLVGAILMESLEVYVRPSYRDIILRTKLTVEQESLASRAARENRPLEAAFHRWVVVNTEAEDGFRALRMPNKELDADPYLFPFQLLVLKWMWSDVGYKRASKHAEGINRGKLAVALDALGQEESAERQWQEAHRRANLKTLEETKAAVLSTLRIEATSTAYRRVEDIILGNE